MLVILTLTEPLLLKLLKGLNFLFQSCDFFIGDVLYMCDLMRKGKDIFLFKN